MGGARGWFVMLGLAALAALAACRFDTSGAPYGNDVAADAGPDGPGPGPGPDAVPDAAQGQPPTDCPTGFATVTGAPVTSKYRAIDADENWSSARFLCAELAQEGAVARTHLLALETQEEYQALIPLYAGESQQLGLSRLPLGAWDWVTGEVANEGALPWGEGEPDGTRNCAAIVFLDGPQGNGDVARLRATNCLGSIKRNYVCECEDGVGDVLF